MLRSEWKETFILLVFAFMLQEILTIPTLVLIGLGSLLVLSKVRLSKLIRNGLVLVMFFAYWYVYGKVIDTEAGLNFLTTVIVIKFLEKENLRDQYMIFFGLVLLLATGSLFEKTLAYVFFFSVSLLVLIQDLYRVLKIKWKLKDLGEAILWILPLACIFFLFTPRILNPFAPQATTPLPGEVGYTPDVNISEVESLVPNERKVFEARVQEKIDQKDLYWRGNTLFFSDGWNWHLMPQDRSSLIHEDQSLKLLEGVKQEIRLLGRESFFFILDHGTSIKKENKTYFLNELKTLPQKNWQWILKYEAHSFPGGKLLEERPDSRRYLRSSFTRADEAWIKQTFPKARVKEMSEEVRSYFRKEGFSYSLAPGKISDFKTFMQIKKVGFCSHYASATALILRTQGIPTRLVSGFMGGHFNAYANSYMISQNDAHAWVEAWEDGEWQRLDPTEWIAPARIALGGEAFLSQTQGAGLKNFPFLKTWLAPLQDLRQWFGQWDFRFYQWLEEMDYYGQRNFLAKIHFKREWFYVLAPILLSLFMAFYGYYLKVLRTSAKKNEWESLWHLFQIKLEKQGLSGAFISLKDLEEKIMGLESKDRKVFLEIFHKLVEISFRDQVPKRQKWKELNQELRKL